MDAPLASPDSHDEGNNEPSVNNNHKDPERSQKYVLQRVRLRSTKQAKRTDTYCNTEATN